MRRGIIVLAAAVFLIVSLAQFAAPASVAVSAGVSEQLNSYGKAKIVVMMKDDSRNLGLKGIYSKEFSQARARRDSLLGALREREEQDFQMTYKAESENGFTAEVSEDVFEDLKNNPNVASIRIAKDYHILLQESVSVINGTLVTPLNISGINLTGAGQTVCVVDTGVNYSHPDLGGCLGGTCKVLEGFAFTDAFTANLSDPMDNHRHGTHVAGIVAANGTILGVAPGASIVALKACNSAGSCPDQAIIDSINWCSGNATRLNITIISMSLGGDDYYTYCDSTSPFTTAINTAVARNITVVVASGNNGSTTGISDPGCVRNSTSVSSVTNADALSGFSNRNNITSILAPGSSINSTWKTGSCSGCTCSGNYMTCSGTSMATPHVAGAIALLKQYKKIESNTNLTTLQLKDILNRSGKNIADSGSGVNLSRMNVHSALFYIEGTAPVLTAASPANTTYLSNASFALNYSVSDNFNLTNCWYSLDSAANATLPSCGNSSFNASEGPHSLRVYANDTAGNENTSTISFTVLLTPAVSLLAPFNGSSSAVNATQNFSCNASDSSGLQNITLQVWNASSVLVATNTTSVSGTAADNNFTFALPYEGIFRWNCKVSDNTSTAASASVNRTVIYDLSGPVVALVSPANGSNYTDSDNVSFLFTITDASEIANCSLIINSGVNRSNTSAVSKVSNQTLYSALFNNLVTPYNWSVNCTDEVSNQGASSLQQLFVDGRNLTICNNLLSANASYYLIQNVTNLAAPLNCMNLSASDVNLDCQGYLLNGSYSSPSNRVSGISGFGRTNVTVQNCRIDNWLNGIVFNSSSNVWILNNTISASSSGWTYHGMYMGGVTGSSSASNENAVLNNTIMNSVFAMRIENASNNTIRGNNITLNSVGIVLVALSSGTLTQTINNSLVYNSMNNNSNCAINTNEGTKHNILNGNNITPGATGQPYCLEGENNSLIIIGAKTNGSLEYGVNISNASVIIKDSYIERYYFGNSSITVENVSNSKIALPNITQNGTNFSDVVEVRNNYASLNSSQASGLNKSANVTFFNLGMNNPRILVNGAPCTNGTCTRVVYNSSNGTLIFNVSGFSTYSAEDYCGNNFCDGVESCSSCSDCGACPAASSGSGGGGGSSSFAAHSLGNIDAKTEGVSRELKSGDRMRFNVSQTSHTLLLKSVTEASGSFELNSSSYYFTLVPGQAVKFNFTSGLMYDFSVILNGITESSSGKKANVTLRAISEFIQHEPRPVQNASSQQPGEEGHVPSQGNNSQNPPVLDVKKEHRQSTLKLLLFSLSAMIVTILYYMHLKYKKIKKIERVVHHIGKKKKHRH